MVNLFNHIDLLQDVTMSYKLGKQKLDEIADKALNEKTMWDEVVQQFNERFCNMPFSLGVKNQKDVMLKGELPTISFIYKSHDEEREVDEEMLLRRLSNGEKKRYIC